MDSYVSASADAPTEKRNERSNYVFSELSLASPAVKVNLNVDSIVEASEAHGSSRMLPKHVMRGQYPHAVLLDPPGGSSSAAYHLESA